MSLPVAALAAAGTQALAKSQTDGQRQADEAADYEDDDESVTALSSVRGIRDGVRTNQHDFSTEAILSGLRLL